MSRKQVVLVISAGGWLFVMMAFWGMYRDANRVERDDLVAVAEQEQVVAVIDENKEDRVVIDIGGSVNNPGVYEFRGTVRVAQVVEKAGGFADEVDLAFVNKTLNLAELVRDGEKLYLPSEVEAVEAGKNGVLSTELGMTGISINNASQKELQTLTGIGEVRAKAVIDARPFSSVQELLERGILTEKIFANIKEQITL
jgi:competence protein ComEA